MTVCSSAALPPPTELRARGATRHRHSTQAFLAPEQLAYPSRAIPAPASLTDKEAQL